MVQQVNGATSMSKQVGTPTVIRVGRTKSRVGIVTTVSTSSSFTATFHVYTVHAQTGHTTLHKSYGMWYGEKGAIDAYNDWVEQQGGLVR